MRSNLLRPLGVGELLDGAFTVYREHFPRLFVTALILLFPLQVLTGLQDRLVLWAGGPELLLLLVPLYLLGALGFMILWPGQTWQIAEALHGREAGFGEAVQRGVGSLLRLIGAILLAGIVYMVLLTIVTILFGVGGAIFAGVSIASGTGAGTVMATVAVIAIMVGFTVVSALVFAALFAIVPLVVIEGVGPVQAIKRSLHLSKGARLRIVGVLMLSYLIVFLPMLGVMTLTGTLATLYDPEAALLLSNTQVALQVISFVVLGALTTPFWMACQTLLYFDRRVRAEAYDLEIATDALVVAS